MIDEAAVRARWATPIGPDLGAKVDAVVIGSGAGGAPVALTLARAGYRVLVLEKGPAYDQRDFFGDEIRTSRRDFFVPLLSEDPHVRVDEHGHTSRTTEGWTANCVGGATVHFSGFTYRLHPEDLKLRSWLGPISGTTLADWPISWAELEPYYERAEYELGVSGDARKNPFETFRRPLPLPPLPENGFAKLIDQAARGLGWHSYPTARAIVSQPYHGRAACRRTHFCGSFGCDTGAKSSTLAALLPRAVATGRCQIRPLCMAHQIETDANGRAVAVRYLDRDKKMQRVATAIVVVACSSIESARLLLMSKQPAHPEGLGNAHGLVGRNLMFACFAQGEAEFSRKDPRIGEIDWTEPFVNRSLQDFYLVEGPPRRKGGTISLLLPHGNPIFNAERLATTGDELLWGTKLKDAIRRLSREIRILEFEAFSETLPMADSRVTLDPEVRDRFGLPVARFEVKQHALDREVSGSLAQRGLTLLKALKPERARIAREGKHTYWLQGGTCRFGSDAKNSVLDRDCRVHTAPNVFVTDGSFMPTLGAVPNTLTIEANAFRVGDRIVALGKQHRLHDTKTRTP